jgi:ATP-dependent Clp protease ATP-binding subunit ClpC
MMDDLTPRGQQVLALARHEAERFHHNYVGTEHLLLGLIKLGQGVAVNVLQRMGLDLEQVRTEVERHAGPHSETKMVGNMPYTPRVKKVLVLAGKEAKALNHSLRRYRTHFAGALTGRGRNRRTGIKESGS